MAAPPPAELLALEDAPLALDDATPQIVDPEVTPPPISDDELPACDRMHCGDEVPATTVVNPKKELNPKKLRITKIGSTAKAKARLPPHRWTSIAGRPIQGLGRSLVSRSATKRYIKQKDLSILVATSERDRRVSITTTDDDVPIATTCDSIIPRTPSTETSAVGQHTYKGKEEQVKQKTRPRRRHPAGAVPPEEPTSSVKPRGLSTKAETYQ